MKLEPLHARFIEEFSRNLPEWKFVASGRHFKKALPGRNLLVHISFINHVADFDATIDVAVEFLSARKRLCIIGAELGNIEGIGQVRHSVCSEDSAVKSAHDALKHLKRIGFPFLERFANPSNVLSALKENEEDAVLISPLEQLRTLQISALEGIANAG
jgi:hypothetical protein